ncbi:MAG TPA: Uma2 family endonuclease, partial [Candidatus Sericytochromatia bacterium]
NYKIWEEGQVPVVIFEITSESTKSHDEGYKRILYEQLEVQEYWQFDPKGEWLEEQLRGYRLRGERYEPITDDRLAPLQLRLNVDGQRIAFFREDTGEKLLASGELTQALREEVRSRQQAEERAEQERQRAEQEWQRAEQERQRADQAEVQVAQLKEQLRSLGIDPEI